MSPILKECTMLYNTVPDVDAPETDCIGFRIHEDQTVEFIILDETNGGPCKFSSMTQARAKKFAEDILESLN
jgi:hypothetical protein